MQHVIEQIRLWAPIIVAALALAWTIYWSRELTRKSAAKEEQDRLAGELVGIKDAIAKDEKADSEKFGEMNSRLQSVEYKISHLPTKDQVHALELAMSDLKGDLKEVAMSIRPLAALVDKMDDFLRDQSKRT